MGDSGSRRASFILLGAAAVLLLAIFIGNRMGNRVITHATELGQTGVGNSILATPTPDPNEAKPYGPNWKRTQVLAAAPDPGFPDPRVPPIAPPTPAPTPKFSAPPTSKPVPLQAAPTPVPTPTPNKNLPIWRQAKPLPIGSNAPSASPAASPSGLPSSPEPSPPGPASPPPG